MSLYTKRGDGGLTDLADGKRVGKSDARVEAYGTLDELGAALGLARALATDGGHSGLAGRILDIQRRLSSLSGWVATPGAPSLDGQVMDAQVRRLEADIDQAMAAAGPLREFVMPGKSQLEAALHLARTVCRRAERRMVELSEREGGMDDGALRYLNRLSDWLFAVSRTADGGADF